MCDTCGCNITPGNAHLADGKTVEVLENLLHENDHVAAHNREHFARHGVLALNLMSSPGSGKTSLLEATIEALGGELKMAVVEGDLETENDAERIRATGAPALQINTGKGCHLDAHMVGHAVESLAPADGSVLFIENVGNLVCPAAFDLGEAHKVAILSVTEGEDKPVKYPDMFHAADLIILNKIDLLPYLQFDVAKCLEYAHRVKPGVQILQLSATSGEGMENWLQWIRMTRQTRLLGHPSLQSQSAAVPA